MYRWLVFLWNISAFVGVRGRSQFRNCSDSQQGAVIHLHNFFHLLNRPECYELRHSGSGVANRRRSWKSAWCVVCGKLRDSREVKWSSVQRHVATLRDSSSVPRGVTRVVIIYNWMGNLKIKHKQYTHCTYNLTLRRFRVSIVAVEKINKYYMFWVCVLALGTQHAVRMRHIVICALSGSTVFFHVVS